jgi:uncharacterized protein (DUF111 family)
MSAGFETDEVYRLETNLDDCPGEVLGGVMERLFAAGALDVWFEPITMKKNRPGVMLCALSEEGARDAVADLILTETNCIWSSRGEDPPPEASSQVIALKPRTARSA